MWLFRVLVMAALTSCSGATSARDPATPRTQTARPRPSKVTWANLVEGGGPTHVAVAPDGRFATDLTEGVFGYDPTGKQTWKLEAALFVEDMAFAPDGDLVIAAWILERMTLGGRAFEATDDDDKQLLLRISPTGTVRWATQLADNLKLCDLRKDDFAPSPKHCLAIAPNNEIVVYGMVGPGEGQFIARYAATGAERWQIRYAKDDRATSAYAIAVDAHGDVYMLGEYSIRGRLGDHDLVPRARHPSADIVVAKLAGDSGAFVWVRTLGSEATDRATALAIAGDGSVIVAGDVDEPGDLGCGRSEDKHAFASALSARDGSCVWARSLTPSPPRYARTYLDALAVDARGIVASGYLPEGEKQNYQRVLVGLSPTGELQWRGDIDVALHDLVLGRRGEILIGGALRDERQVFGTLVQPKGSVVQAAVGELSIRSPLVALQLE